MAVIDTLKKRYFYKVISGIVTGLTAVVSQAVLSRGLGAVQFGNFSFLTDFFMQFLSFVNAGTSTAFYTKLSKRSHEFKLVLFYFSYIGIAVVFTVGFVIAINIIGLKSIIWPGQQLGFILAAVFFGGFNWVFNSMNDVVDAYGLTVVAEKIKAWQRIIAMGIMLILFELQWVNLGSMFCFNSAILICLIMGFVFVCKEQFKLVKLSPLSKSDLKDYAHEFYMYAHPLLLISFIGLAAGLFDRWFLQIVSGGRQQGFYSLSFKVGALCFLFTGAMTQLITREFSIAYENKNLEQIAFLFRRHIPLLYGITAIIVCFIIANADKVALLIGGKDFKEACLAIAVMSFYPIHQTYGQLSSAVFFATDQTRLYCKVIGIGFFIGSILTYLLIATPMNHGFGMGAIGLAIKMVVMGILINNVLLYFNAKFLKLPLGWYLWHQFISVFLCMLIAFIATIGVDHFFHSAHVLLRFVLTGFCYGILIVPLVINFPVVLGLGSNDIVKILDKIRVFLKRSFKLNRLV